MAGDGNHRDDRAENRQSEDRDDNNMLDRHAGLRGLLVEGLAVHRGFLRLIYAEHARKRLMTF